MGRRQVVVVVAVVAAALAVWGVVELTKARRPLTQVAKEVRTLVRRKSVDLPGTSRAEATATWKLVRAFYKKRSDRPAWTDGRGPRPAADRLVEAVDRSRADGLSPEQYEQERLATEIRALSRGPLGDPPAARALAELDVRCTYDYFRLANHLLNGRVSPRTLDPDWRTTPRQVDLVAVLRRAIAKRRVIDSLADLSPRDPRYARLREAFARYSEIVAKGGWPAIPPGPPLRRGQAGPRVEALARRLEFEGDAHAAGRAFDARLEQAVRRYQIRHGLPATGAVDAATLAALDVPAGERLRTIQLNLERWRWLPAALGSRYVLVNIPDYRLNVFDGGRAVLSMAVVVGKRMSPTPMFSDRAVAVEVNPYWNIPAGIAAAEIGPHAQEDEEYLARSHIRVLTRAGEGGEEKDERDVDWSDSSGASYALRQDPGPDNPLGRIKIALPNEYDVYLHDTPAGHLFGSQERDFSHGCIRVEKPVELAELLLRGGKRKVDLRQAIASGKNQWIPLPEKIPVHILYWTAWVDEDGTVQFRNDVYGHDARLDRALRTGAMSTFRINAT